jgi:5'(3')-deoxyribonucleotidase
MKPNVCFLDMDGVLVDFVTGICEAHGLDNPYLKPEALGEFDMAKLWGMSNTAFWRPAKNLGLEFWASLKPTLYAKELVTLVESEFENVAILTAPSSDPSCIPGKRLWIEQHFPQFKKKIIFASAESKRLVAAANKVLIDDRDSNVEEWNQHSGIGVTFPCRWNKFHSIAHDPLSYVEFLAYGKR